MTSFPRKIALLTLALLPCSLSATGEVAKERAAGLAFFESKVRPILIGNCYGCHSEQEGKRKGGLWLDRKAGWAEGGDAGPTVLPGDADGSLLIHAIRYTDEDLQMPPKSRLKADEVSILEEWVTMGAPDPRSEALAGAVRKKEIDYDEERKKWAYRPLQKPSVPGGDASGTVDRFLLARLGEEGIRPASEATPERLIRRVHYDLTGLPPTSDEVAAFLSDSSEDAFSLVVDDLLSRPAFGEKWGRHWLDVARYADSNGGDRNFTFYQAWRYRNWVIDSFNRDLSYYDFVRAQLAGDLLPWENDQQRAEQLIAATFLSLGPKMLTERDKEKLWLDTVDEQVDTMGRAFLGLTLGCARCHDHKFDPVSQEDYYAVAGIFRSTEVVTGTRNGCVNVASWIERALPVPGEEGEELKKKVERLQLAMRLTVEKSFMKKAGGKMALGNLPLAGVIYDEEDAELIGNWKDSTYSSNRFGAKYVHDDQKGKGENRAIFRASLPESGIYEVRVAYSPSGNRADKVPITVVARDGKHRVSLDETITPKIGGLFQPIGQFDFEKGGKVEVIFDTHGTEGRYVIVDAVQFISVDDIAREAMAVDAVNESDIDPLFRMSEGDLKKELNKLINDLKDEEVAMAPRDAAKAQDVHLRVRGEVNQLGAVVPRNFLKVLYDGPDPKIEEGESGRLQLAEWIVNPESGLLDRVMVNRIWLHLFGRGIVESVDNFGRLGTPPTHPELLEYLAFTFRESGGSIKSLVREIATSEAYRMSSAAAPEITEADPANQWFSRQNRRRLTAEEIRDGILFMSGELDREPAFATASKHGVDLDKPLSFAKEKKRTVYLPVARNNPATELAVFDAANPDLVSGQRSQTTVPTQALYLLNSEFIHKQAGLLGNLATQNASRPGEEVTWLYQTLLGRAPNPVELQQGLGLIADLSGGSEEKADLAVATGHLAHVLLASTEFLYLD
ncbi:MAG: DUF1549 domain-containing protein [Verrucomicrobiales bacterium]|nr:DUF1549 domain-containing protein [Verrucomicrobiales bacterium]